MPNALRAFCASASAPLRNRRVETAKRSSYGGRGTHHAYDTQRMLIRHAKQPKKAQGACRLQQKVKKVTEMHLRPLVPPMNAGKRSKHKIYTYTKHMQHLRR